MKQGIINSNIVKAFAIEPIDEYKPKDGFRISAIMNINGDCPVPIKDFSSKNKAKEHLNKLGRRLNAETFTQITKAADLIFGVLEQKGKL